MKVFGGFLLLFASAAAAHDVPLSVGDVWARHHELDGQVLRIRGIVTNCQPLSCQLRESATAKARWLSLGSSTRFDAAVKNELGREIVVEGRLDSTCLHLFADPPSNSREIVVCADRFPTIVSPKLIEPAQ